MTINENAVKKVEDTINNALDGDVVLSVVQAATDSNGLWMDIVASINAVGTLIIGVGTLVVAVWAVRLTRRQTDIQDASRKTADANLSVAESNLEIANVNKSIASGHLENEEKRRKNELFDRRFKVYEAAMAMLTTVKDFSHDKQKNKTNFDKVFDDFKKMNESSPFLFGLEVCQYLNGIQQRGYDWKFAWYDAIKEDASDDDREKFVAAENKLVFEWADDTLITKLKVDMDLN